MKASSQAQSRALAKGDQKRLERLAALAGRSPRVMLKFVLRDGFDAVEDDIHETLAAERDMALYGAVPHAEVMRSAKKSLRRRAVEISKPQAGNTRLCRSQTSINP